MSKLDQRFTPSSPLTTPVSRTAGALQSPNIWDNEADDISYPLVAPDARLRFKTLAVGLIRDRQLRARFFPSSMLAITGFDVLLSLYADDDSRRLNVTNLVTMVPIPHATLARWLRFFEAQGLSISRPAPTDARVRQLEISKKGRAILDHYFLEILRSP